MGYKHWETPLTTLIPLHHGYRFTLDAASHEGAPSNDLIGRWWSEYDDALSQCWAGERIFCNPPYLAKQDCIEPWDYPLYDWVEKAAEGEADLAVLLLPPSIDTAWFHDFIYRKPNVTHEFLRGRIRFWKDGKPGDAPRAGNLIAVFWHA